VQQAATLSGRAMRNAMALAMRRCRFDLVALPRKGAQRTREAVRNFEPCGIPRVDGGGAGHVSSRAILRDQRRGTSGRGFGKAFRRGPSLDPRQRLYRRLHKGAPDLSRIRDSTSGWKIPGDMGQRAALSPRSSTYCAMFTRGPSG